MALENMGLKRPKLVSFWRERTVKRERREGEKFKQAKRYGTTWAFKALNGFPCNCMVISCLQPRVFARVSS